MKAIYSMVGERKSCITMSNLGEVKLPAPMDEFVERFDFTLGVQSKTHNNCGIISYKDHLYINLIRNIQEFELEQRFFKNISNLGISVDLQAFL